MQISRHFLSVNCFIICILSLGGCFAGGYDFSTKAEYRAPINNYEISIDAKGHVSSGEDLSNDGKAVVDIIQKPSDMSLHLEVNYPIADYKLPGGETGKVQWDRNAATSLEIVLDKAGFKTDSAQEIMEAIRVIDGAQAGPKGTVLDGQTKILDVVSVQFLQ